MGQRGFLAKVKPLLRSPFSIETPYGFLAEVEPPIIDIGPPPKFSADFYMHGPIGVVRFLFALALRVVMVVFDGFEMSCALVFCAE